MLVGVLSVASASADTIVSFDELPDGAEVTTQVLGVTVAANNPHAGAPDAARVYNFTAYPDLAYGGQQHDGGWDGGNIASFNTLGKGLVIAGPDPEKILERRRPAGDLIFDFDRPVSSFGLTLVDVEGPEEFVTDTGYFIDFVRGGTSVLELDFADFITPGSSFYDPTIAFGNHTANRISPITAAQAGVANFDRVEVSLGGSAVVGSIRFDTAGDAATDNGSKAVPSPSALLGGLSLLGIAALRRRRGRGGA